MSQRILHVLGTASQVPTRYRNHNGYFLEWDDLGFLFDPGEGTQRQMLLSGLAVSRINHIMITHFHGDHCLGLPGIIQRLSLDRVSHPVGIWYPASGQKYFERLRHASIFHETTQLEVHPIKDEGILFATDKLEVSTLPLDHTVESWGYRIREKDGVTMLPERLAERGIAGPAIGELARQGYLDQEGGRIELHEVSRPRPGQGFALIMDTRLCDNAFRLAQEVDLLACESTFLSSESKEAREYGHLTADQAGRIAARANARRLVLTHFSQRYPSLEPFEEEAAAHHPDVVAVRDGDKVAVPSRREISK